MPPIESFSRMSDDRKIIANRAENDKEISGACGKEICDIVASQADFAKEKAGRKTRPENQISFMLLKSIRISLESGS